jgi:hypothetical protein
VRIATWNLERGKRGARRSGAYDDQLHALQADVVVVTEPGPGFADRHPGAVTAPPLRQGSKKPEVWVAILGDALKPVAMEIPYKHLAVAATTILDGRDVVVYGSVLPWLSARAQASDVYGSTFRPFLEVFTSALGQQVEDMRRLRAAHPGHALLWAGDFNHPLVAPHVHDEASAMLESALRGMGLRAYNASEPHREPGWHALDLICGPLDATCRATTSSYPVHGGKPLSDHRAYVVELEVAS